MLPYIITILIVISLSVSLITGAWRVSRYLVIPMQVVLFIILIGVCIKVFFKSENFDSLHKGVKESGVAELQQKVLKTTVSEAQKIASSPADQRNNSKEASNEDRTSIVPEKKNDVSTSTSAPAPKKQIDVLDYM